MKVKKYTADTMNEAMKLVRTELGEEAVILNSKAVYSTKFFGFIKKRQVEVIAAIDELENVKQEEYKSKNNYIENRPKHFDYDKVPPISDINENVDIANSLKEMKSLIQKLELDKQKSNWSTEMVQIEKKLLQFDIPDEMVTEAMGYVLEVSSLDQLNNKNVIKEKVIEHFNALTVKLEFSGKKLQKKYISLVGPTGVGKTTTLAKLAAHVSLKEGKKIGFITTDTYRIAAIDQLKTYANILDAPLEVCYNAEDFIKAKKRLENVDLIFIDTAGRNYLDAKYVQDLKNIINFNDDVETYLVLSLTSKLTDMKKIANQFSHVNFEQFIFTKLDETSSSGAMFAMMKEFNKGVAFITTGQGVPEDIQPMSQSKVMNLIEEGLK
ncbi:MULTISPECIES: flagellar biosynthesis protein FlhF [Bacillus]|uniref:flagellar biosynthesis protein FlhF n=1 Tax=Bacillus TaxID=1386 RepID=UPI000BB87C7E|nr:MULTISPECIES: flagellar biosynthesis protein FlhF [Bacillus]